MFLFRKNSSDFKKEEKFGWKNKMSCFMSLHIHKGNKKVYILVSELWYFPFEWFTIHILTLVDWNVIFPPLSFSPVVTIRKFEISVNP